MKRIYYVVLAIILLCGCDSFLDVTPKGMLLPEKVQDFDEMIEHLDCIEWSDI